MLEKYGLDYEALHQLNPGLVYCSITGYGQDGPYADRPGYDGVFQAMSGMMSVSGIPDGEPGAGPMKVGISMIDILTGLYAGNAILAALRHREVGRRRPASTSTSRCSTAASHRSPTTRRTTSSRAWPRPGAATAASAASPRRPSRAPTARRSSSSPARPGSGRALAKVIGRPELAYDERFATVSARIAHRDLVLRTLDEVFRTRSASDWIPELEAADVPVSPVNDLDGVFANPQVRAPRPAHDGRPPGLGSGRPAPQPDPAVRARPSRTTARPRRWASTPTRSSRTCWAWGSDEIARLERAGAI